ncbi:threalose-6-phosphate phosphatase [Apophysomyces ossiformis]|uniref:Threalose-6-phosphate phosphatase n=1 Tax=Apophysomyces ossiformis TaxID=679940 RepID=A0A8H7BTU3_9FUNG|nr:threalose-6-phosphate phosphatase [Apophysomyces ossiformis]
MSTIQILTPDHVASYLPLTPHIQGRIINVTHQIPYTITRAASPVHIIQRPPSPPPPNHQENDDEEEVIEPVTAAPVSKLARHHRRGKTIRAKFHAANWTLVESRGHGALFSGLQSLQQSWETIHIGWTGPIGIEGSNQPEQLDHLDTRDRAKLENLLWKTKQIVPIFLDHKSRGHYEGYCKEVLWPLLHYLVMPSSSDGHDQKKNWGDYVAVNQIFAEKILEHYRPGDIIFVNDYHLCLVPQMVRDKLPDVPIGMFIHTTFPSSEIFRCLTACKQILHGILGANLVGFQTYAYARHFISTCTRVLGCESSKLGVNVKGSIVSVGSFPIGIDIDRIDRFRKQPGVQPKVDAIRSMYNGKKIIIGRDKMDSAKGILHKLRAYKKFLHDYPQWRGKVVLIQVTTPTHDEHSKLETKVSELVSQINGLYGSLEFTPVHHYHQDIDRDEYYALLSVADVALITSVRDGMNTTSFEYIICQDQQYGPLILSEFTGTAGSFGAAILINPWDYAGVSKAILEALSMSPEEKRTRHQQLYNHVTTHTASVWAHSFVKQLVSVAQELNQSRFTPVLNKNELLEKYAKANRRVLFFDYDGTLTPIVSVPSEAKPGAQMLQSLQTLCSDPKNEVWIISGRDQATLEKWLGHIPNLNFSAEHGCFLKPAKTKDWSNVVDDIDMSWKQDVIEIFDYYTERTQGSFIEHKKSSVSWHYRLADAEYGAFQANECQNHLENSIVSKFPVEILVGKKNLEVRPVLINKGEVVKKVLAQVADADFIMCAGDDKTDEDMFQVLNIANSNKAFAENKSIFTTTVGSSKKKTMADWHVPDCRQLTDILNDMATIR